jgi:hypothetical protein
LKALAGNQELLAYTLDFAAFHFSTGYRVLDGEERSVEIHFICFSANSSVPNDEVNLRVKRFGRYATIKELEQFFKKFEKTDQRFDFDYPMVTHSIATGQWTGDYEYTEISLRLFTGEMEFGQAGCGGSSDKKTGMVWAAGTMFAVVPQEKPSWETLSSRKSLKKLENASLE